MIDRVAFEADDRVLLMSIPDPDSVAALARRLTAGLLVGLGDSDQVSAARRAARDFANVMFVPASPEEIPWQDEFFSRVIEPGESLPAMAAWREIARVLAPGGLLHLTAVDEPVELPEHGFVLVGRTAGVTTLRREG